jgi:hypothetical protein
LSVFFCKNDHITPYSVGLLNFTEPASTTEAEATTKEAEPRHGEARISGDWRLKWRWWFLRATSIGTRSSASPTPPTSTQHWLSGTAASSDVGSRRTSTSSRHPVAPVGHRRQHLAWRLCCTTVVLEGRTSSCTIPRRVTTDRATPHLKRTSLLWI